ncbi:MAG: transposase [Thermodesulfovibrionales bacterium]|nr:transposase [Thermodesulfovibrionales bacterium]
MARKPRIEYEGAFYHVITRGNQRQRVFKGDDDFQKYISLLAFYKERNKYSLYAYVLMSNHVHLLIETRTIPLSKILQGINQSYTMYFNRKYKTVGHLFQGRYKAILCDKDAYLLSLIKYIHLNPVRAKIAKTPGEYLWSSHQSYDKQKKDDIVATDQVLRMFSEEKAQARKLYRAYMDEGLAVKKEEIYKTVSQRILGEEKFVDTVMEKIEERIENKRKHHEYSLKEIAETIGRMRGITLKQLRGKSKNREILTVRRLASLAAREFSYKGKEIAFFLEKDPSVIARYLQGGETFNADLDRALNMLSDKSIRNKQV